MDALRSYFSSEPDIIIWFDVFSAPQHQVQEVPKPPEWWMQTFKSAIESMGSLILVADSWGEAPAKLNNCSRSPPNISNKFKHQHRALFR
jgi:hypothetical protein